MTVEERETERPGHAVELATELVSGGGFDLLLAVGGDGTVSEVAAGMLGVGSDGELPILGVMPLGAGNDFQRTAGGLVTGGDLATRLAEAEPAVMDAGRIRFEEEDRADQYFVNVANVGFSAAVGERVERSFRSWPRMAGYLVGAIVTLAGYGNPWIELEIDGERRECRANSVIMALGNYFGQGMKVAPDAVADDGLFDVVLIQDIGKLELLAAYPRLYTGSHVRHPKVEVMRGGRVSIRADRGVAVEGDGDMRGALPATFEVLPGALRVIA
jgi:YegS/Rv2252/BmrU family lipid kinase